LPIRIGGNAPCRNGRLPRAVEKAARRRGIEGTVKVGLEVGPGGAVARAWVLRSSGSRALDRAALENVRAWAFEANAPGPESEDRVFFQDVRFFLR